MCEKLFGYNLQHVPEYVHCKTVHYFNRPISCIMLKSHNISMYAKISLCFSCFFVVVFFNYFCSVKVYSKMLKTFSTLEMFFSDDPDF